MLRLSLFVGQGAYIGRGIRVTVADHYRKGAKLTIEHPDSVVASGPEVSVVDHVNAQRKAEQNGHAGEPEAKLSSVEADAGEVVSIGRAILITVLRLEAEGAVQIGIDAPRSVAVSRDAFTLEEHLDFQGRREAQHRMRRA